MSFHYAPLVPEGITKKECERGSLHFEAPVPYVPPKCKLTKEHGVHSITVKMGKDIEEQAPICNGGIVLKHMLCVCKSRIAYFHKRAYLMIGLAGTGTR